jgi:predicted RNA-binding Zn-ribbon protein involved in translation (DUF1610 family)
MALTLCEQLAASLFILGAGQKCEREIFFGLYCEGMGKNLNSSFGMVDPAFRGHCPQCGEVYVIRSKKDDLEGIIFQCRKIGCAGKVSLEVDVRTELVDDSKESSTIIRFN